MPSASSTWLPARNRSRSPGEVSRANLSGWRPVSYTHLDVYKRQVKDLVREQQFEVSREQLASTLRVELEQTRALAGR